MRVAIREQLVLFVTLNVLVGLTVVALPTWFFVHRFVVNVSSESLALTASIKASKITADLQFVRNSCRTIASRILIQTGLHKWYASRIAETWEEATKDLQVALSSRLQTGLLQARIYTRDGSGDTAGIVNVTGNNIPRMRLPYDIDGSPAYLGGDDDDANTYPAWLYPNITYDSLGTKNEENNLTEFAAYAPGNISLQNERGLLLGPMSVNESFALVSVTLPILDYEQPSFVLGYLTVVAAATTLISNAYSREGLGDTGLVLFLGPDNPENRFNETTKSVISSGSADEEFLDHVDIHYVLPALSLPGQADRHQNTAYDVRNRRVFPASDYPAALRALEDPPRTVNQAGSMLSTRNENGANVAVGFARTNTSLVDWTVLVEQSRDEAYQPIIVLSRILLACVLGSALGIFLMTYPLAHMSVLPIRRLKAATEKTVTPPGYEDGYFDSQLHSSEGATPGSGTHSSQRTQRSIKGWVGTVLASVGIRPTPTPGPARASAESESRPFKIPGKVVDRKHLITDELTELTKTFNDMSDELQRQYTVLDDKVAERTRELEISKKAAEAANESKTLFIANISHELKTPLNGILGMCAVCMEEDDLDKIKQSLRTLYKSGVLLLHLLEDLLSFSKNQIGKQLALEQKEFGLADIRSQILTIFDKQVRESGVNLSVLFLNADSVEAAVDGAGIEPNIAPMGPQGTGRLKDMRLYGDQHRILQVIINLVSNSLKFTPRGGRVEVRIKCLGETKDARDASRSSSASKSSNAKRKRLASTSTRTSSRDAQGSGLPVGTALTINPMEPKVTPPVYARGRSPTPPEAGARSFEFVFEIEDTGPGIPEEMQKRVFEPFVQGDWGLSRKFGGTGLGLSICQQLAGLMGGNITLRSTIGAGSVFTMQIPLTYVKYRTPSVSSSVQSYKLEDGDPEPSPNPAGPNASKATVLDRQPWLVGLRKPFFAARANGCGRPCVLVADDNATNVEVVSRMLHLEDVHDVTVAKDGQEAYEQVRDAMTAGAGFDIIFMDVQMPNVDGLQSTRLIRGMGYTSPIVALTAFDAESNMRECLESGMDEFLTKPIRRPDLKKVLLRFATIEEGEELEGTTPSEEVGTEGILPGVDGPTPI